MDIEALLDSIGGQRSKNNSNQTATKIETMTLECAAHAGGASQAAAAIIQCMGAAALPLVKAFYGKKNTDKASAQDRLLFALVLAGAVISLSERDDGMEMTTDISPLNLSEAFSTYTKLTGKDITPHLPPQMVAFAHGRIQQKH